MNRYHLVEKRVVYQSRVLVIEAESEDEAIRFHYDSYDPCSPEWETDDESYDGIQEVYLVEGKEPPTEAESFIEQEVGVP
jgi:hypothetical protein